MFVCVCALLFLKVADESVKKQKKSSKKLNCAENLKYCFRLLLCFLLPWGTWHLNGWDNIVTVWGYHSVLFIFSMCVAFFFIYLLIYCCLFKLI